LYFLRDFENMGKEVTKPVKKEFKRKPDFKKNKFRFFRNNHQSRLYNNYSKKREEERPSQFSKTAAERRKEIGEKARDRKRAAKAKQEAEKQEKVILKYLYIFIILSS